jgi:hypothetical protein
MTNYIYGSETNEHLGSGILVSLRVLATPLPISPIYDFIGIQAMKICLGRIIRQEIAGLSTLPFPRVKITVLSMYPNSSSNRILPLLLLGLLA